MVFYLGARSRSFAKRVDPRLIDAVEFALTISPVDFGFSEEQSRTLEEQKAKKAAGVSTTLASKHLIGADGDSNAVDCVPWIGGAFTWGDKHDPEWGVTRNGVRTLPFHQIALAMRTASIVKSLPMVWGTIWDRKLADLPDNIPALRQAVEAYKVRHPGKDFLDGPHFQLAL